MIKEEEQEGKEECTCINEYNDDHHPLLVWQCPKCNQAEKESKEQPPDKILDIALDIVFLKYGDDCVQDANFNTDLGKAYDFIQNMMAMNADPTGGKLHGSKERIIECIDNYLKP